MAQQHRRNARQHKRRQHSAAERLAEFDAPRHKAQRLGGHIQQEPDSQAGVGGPWGLRELWTSEQCVDVSVKLVLVLGCMCVTEWGEGWWW